MKTIAISQLETLPYFTKSALRLVAQEPSNTLDVSIRRMIQRGKLIKLKNGYYTTEYFYFKNGHLSEYRELLAGILCQPSYLSNEYVLGKYDLLTEGVAIYTSVTTKTTRSYENTLGSFVYRNISGTLFVGYETKSFGKSSYLIASKAKALFDYMYFRAGRRNWVGSGYDMIKEKRIKIELLSRRDWREIKTYIKLANNSKAETVQTSLQMYAPNF